MDKLEERIRASLENPHGEPWFPELTADLALRAWDNLYRDTGLTPESYGTERVLSRNISASRQIIASLKTGPPTCATSLPISIEALTPKTLIKCRDQGAKFYSQQEFSSSALLSCLKDALGIINEVPSLLKTVCTLVRSLHVIKPEDANYDMSFSEPRVPFSVFVSVPEKRIANDAMRVAEAIVHEAMHLQLTLIEKSIALSVVSPGEFFSPWKEEYRTAQGVLHGLYVFCVVDRFLRSLSAKPGRSAFKSRYVIGRQNQIALQVSAIRDFQECKDLTRVGAAFASQLIGSERDSY